MAKRKSKLAQLRPVLLVILGLICLGTIIGILLRGKDLTLFHPKGLIAEQQFRLMMRATLLMLEIGIPTLLFLYFVVWKYRESNEKATYDPGVHHGRTFVLSLWAFPTVTMLLLAALIVPATHKLEPQKMIAANNPTLTVQVVALRWKWLFIYPDQKIATVNFTQIPLDTPVDFELTADETPMSSFWVPHLGGQLYAMTGHVNRLNLMGTDLGDFQGSAAEINGAGFAGMKFTTRVSTKADFDAWVRDTQSSGAGSLDSAAYAKLLAPSENNTVAYYSDIDPNLYGSILVKNAGSHQHHTEYE